ncbi:MAG: AAC(3) family N-acetyltransferase [Armatimonadetes bacterium]|nr:AAC(3) family N-acetyltransferase [Armatimonadota bacterium]
MPHTEERPTVTRESIARDLSKLGLSERDVVFFHNSMKAIGWVEGGADAVIDAFLDVVGPEGLVVVPTLSWTFAHGEFARHVFDPKETPSRVGKISDTLWRRPNAFRSAHPTHSIAAIGPGAEELVAGHDRTSTFGKDGPYWRYVERGAKIMFLGVELSCNTTLHAIEDWLDLPYLEVERATVKGSDGKPKIVEVTKSPGGHRDFYRNGSKVERLLERAGIIRRGKVGAADTRWMPSQEMVDVVVKGIYGEPTLLLCDREDCEFCTTYRQPTIDHVTQNRPQI